MFREPLNGAFQTALDGDDLLPHKSPSAALNNKNFSSEALESHIEKCLEENRNSVASDTTGLSWCLTCIRGISAYLSEHAAKHKLCGVDGIENGQIEVQLETGNLGISCQRLSKNRNKLLIVTSSRKVFVDNPFSENTTFCKRAEAREVKRIAFSVTRALNQGGVIREFPEQRLAACIQSIGSALDEDGEVSCDMNRRILEHEASALLLAMTQNPILASLGFQNLGRSLRYLVTNEGATSDPLAQLIGVILYVAENNGIDADGIIKNSQNLVKDLLKQRLSLSDSPSLAK